MKFQIPQLPNQFSINATSVIFQFLCAGELPPKPFFPREKSNSSRCPAQPFELAPSSVSRLSPAYRFQAIAKTNAKRAFRSILSLVFADRLSFSGRGALLRLINAACRSRSSRPLGRLSRETQSRLGCKRQQGPAVACSISRHPHFNGPFDFMRAVDVARLANAIKVNIKRFEF